jgi:hypothetical protein
MIDNPPIVILDLDGTIIGDITPQILLYEMSKIKELNVKFTKKILKQKLKKGLIRQKFKTFINSLSNVEFFIYTASEHSWALFIIKCIEENLNIKFNKPIFTRNFCIINESMEIRKDIDKIKQKIVVTLSKKYKNLNTELDNLLIIDNNPEVYYNKWGNNLLICQTYNFRLIENIPTYIDEKIYNKYYEKINEYISKYFSIKLSATNYIDFQKEFYIFYIKYIDYVKKRNNINEDFFINLLKIMVNKHITYFSIKNIEYIRNKLNL